MLTIGSALRIYHLGNRSLWYDEAVTANISRGTLTQVLEKTRRVSAPVAHPYILYLAEKVGNGPVAARAPSVLASLLAIFVILAMVCAGISQSAALFSAAILAVSASQIRYAQEVREYSLTVLFATILIYCFLRWEADGSRGHHPVWLYAVLFLVPLVQNGMVFFAAAVLSAMVLRLWFAVDSRFRLSHVVMGSASLVAGALLSYVLTLRYQLRLGTNPWYLAAYYFDPKTMSLPRFLGTNSRGLWSFFVPGQLVTVCFLVAALIFCVAQVRNRKFDSLTLLVFTSVAITGGASVVKLYPYGGIRQCLFLAPGLILFAGVVIADLLQRIRKSWQPMVTVGFLALILFSGYRGMRKQRPYAEYEDTLSILRELAKSSAPSDQVWVNHDAVEAFQFYRPQRDPRFFYGTFHADANQYLPELSGFIEPRTDRLWLVFSHLQQPSDRAEEQLIVSSLRSGWDVQSVIAPMNTELFVAHRRTSP
ncbi:MAG: glycosyltransferase family 39 protein [Terriglobales bacterium]